MLIFHACLARAGVLFTPILFVSPPRPASAPNPHPSAVVASSPAMAAAVAAAALQAPQSAIEDVREVIREELGEYPETLWRSFDPVAIASASLAQVHRAEGWDGQQLAVKVRSGAGGGGTGNGAEGSCDNRWT